jgi:hypothetical protein
MADYDDGVKFLIGLSQNRPILSHFLAQDRETESLFSKYFAMVQWNSCDHFHQNMVWEPEESARL